MYKNTSVEHSEGTRDKMESGGAANTAASRRKSHQTENRVVPSTLLTWITRERKVEPRQTHRMKYVRLLDTHIVKSGEYFGRKFDI